MITKFKAFKATNQQTYKGLFVGHYKNANPIPYFDQKTIDRYLAQFTKDDLNYLFNDECPLIATYCPKLNAYVFGNIELPKVEHKGKTYFCFALDLQFELK